MKTIAAAALTATALSFTTFADGEKIYLTSTEGYTDESWLTSTNWSNGASPSSSYDYVIDRRCKTASGGTITAQGYGNTAATTSFAGNSLSLGDLNYGAVIFYQRGAKALTTAGADGIYLVNGEIRSWVGGSDTGAHSATLFGSKVTVLAPASAPYLFTSAKHHQTLHFPNEFCGAPDTGIRLKITGGYVGFDLNFSNASKYYGSVDCATPATTSDYPCCSFDVAALKSIKLGSNAYGAGTLTLATASTANTIGDFTGAAGTQVLMSKSPETRLTITNSVTGTLTVNLSGLSFTPEISDTLWTNEYTVLSIPAGVTTSGATISVVDNIASQLSDRFEGTLTRIDGDDGSITYKYKLAQVKYKKVTVVDKGAYTDTTWIDGADRWSVAGVPSPTYDYILDSNAKGSDTSNYEYNSGTFNGNSLEVGDASRSVTLIHNQDRTFNNEGLIFANGTFKSWSANGTASSTRTAKIIGKVKITAKATKPWKFWYDKINNIFEVTDAFTGASDTGITLQKAASAGEPPSVLQLDDAAGYLGSVAFLEPQSGGRGYPTVRLSQSAIKAITFKEGAILEISDTNGVVNTIGDCVGATGAKIVLGGCPQTTLTITNALTGPIIIELNGAPVFETDPFERTIPIVTLPAGTTVADVTIVNNMTLPSGQTGSLTAEPVTNPDGTISYKYTHVQAKGIAYLVGKAISTYYNYTDWTTKGEDWSNTKAPSADYDYIMDGRCAGSPLHSYYGTTFAGNSLQIGDTVNGSAGLIARGNFANAHDGLYLVNGDIRSWQGSGTEAAQGYYQIVSCKMTVKAPVSNPFVLLNAQNYITYVFAGELIGDSDTGLITKPESYPRFGVKFTNAAKYYGSILQGEPTGSSSTYTDITLDRTSLKALTMKPNTTFTLSGLSEENTVGDLTLDNTSKIVFEQFPGTALTITNSLTGPIALELRMGAEGAAVAYPRAKAWTNEYAALVIPDGVAFDEDDISISLTGTSALLPGVTCSATVKKEHKNNATVYSYVFQQDKDAIFANATRTSRAAYADAFWDTSVDHYVNPTTAEAANYYYYVTNHPGGDAYVSFEGRTFYTPNMYIRNAGGLYIQQIYGFVLKGTLTLAGGVSYYNWAKNYTATFDCTTRLLGTHSVLGSMRDNEGVVFTKLVGGANTKLVQGSQWAVYDNTETITTMRTEIRDATEFQGSIVFDGITADNAKFYVNLGNTGADSSLAAVNFSSNFVLGAYAASDVTHIGNLTMGEKCSLRPVSARTGASCVSIDGTCAVTAPIKVLCDKMTYPKAAKTLSHHPVFRWKTGAAALTLADFEIDETGATGVGSGTAWKIWTDGEYTCLGLEIQPAAGLVIFID